MSAANGQARACLRPKKASSAKQPRQAAGQWGGARRAQQCGADASQHVILYGADSTARLSSAIGPRHLPGVESLCYLAGALERERASAGRGPPPASDGNCASAAAMLGTQGANVAAIHRSCAPRGQPRGQHMGLCVAHQRAFEQRAQHHREHGTDQDCAGPVGGNLQQVGREMREQQTTVRGAGGAAPGDRWAVADLSGGGERKAAAVAFRRAAPDGRCMGV